jgi:hypothetical protein
VAQPLAVPTAIARATRTAGNERGERIAVSDIIDVPGINCRIIEAATHSGRYGCCHWFSAMTGMRMLIRCREVYLGIWRLCFCKVRCLPCCGHLLLLGVCCMCSLTHMACIDVLGLSQEYSVSWSGCQDMHGVLYSLYACHCADLFGSNICFDK